MQPTPPTAEGQRRVLGVINAALIAGLVIFFGIFFILYLGESGTAKRTAQNSVDPITMMNLLTFFVVSIVRMFLPGVGLKNAMKKLPRDLVEEDFKTAVYPAYQASHVMNLALLEGPALFSIVTLLINKTNLHHQPALWVNALPAVLGIAIMAMLFPTADRYAQKIKALHSDYLMMR